MDKGKAKATTTEPDREHDSALSYNQLVSGIIDFLEVAFHTILCLRAVYPFEVFARRKKYSHACYQSRHPGLTEYISRVLVAIRREIDRSKISKVILVIRPNNPSPPSGTYSSDSTTNETPHAYERFVFALEYILPASLIDQRNRDLAISDNVTSAELEMIFRGFLQKLMVVDGILYDIPAKKTSTRDGEEGEDTELTFAIVLEMNDEANVPQGAGPEEPETGDWIPADDENLGRSHTSASSARQEPLYPTARPKIRPIKSLDSGVINLMLFVEEDLHLKSGDANREVSQKSGTRNQSSKLEDNLLLARATQGNKDSMSTTTARELKNRAKRLDAERDLDQPVLLEDADADLLHVRRNKKKRKATNARMVLGETRAAETDSDSESENEPSDFGSSQSIRDGANGGGSDMDVY